MEFGIHIGTRGCMAVRENMMAVASAAEELDAQAASLKDMVGQLRQLVGGAVTGPTPTASPMLASRVAVFSSQATARPRPRLQPRKTLSAGRHKAIPMPGDTGPAADADDNFKNF